MEQIRNWIEEKIDRYPDFPKKGVEFYDIGSLLYDYEQNHLLISMFLDLVDAIGAFDKIIAVDARGFLFGEVIALYTHKPLVLARKPGKLPGNCIVKDYSLEYGTNSISIQRNKIQSDDKVLVVDDILATGGTLKAIDCLVESLGAHVVNYLTVIDIKDCPKVEGFEKIKSLTVSCF